MASTDTKVSGVRVSKWICVFGWLQIVGAIFGIILAVRLYNPAEGSFALDYGDGKLMRIVSIIFLVLSILQFLFCVLLLIGNKREKPGLLWAWIVYRAVDCGLGVILGISGATKAASTQLTAFMVWSIIVGVVISAFMIRVVNRRIKDIKIGSGGVTTTEC